MNFRQAVVGGNHEHRAAYRVGSLHVGLLLAALEMICETFVHGFDVGELLVSDLGASELTCKAFERADNRNDLVDLRLRDRRDDGAAAWQSVGRVLRPQAP